MWGWRCPLMRICVRERCPFVRRIHYPNAIDGVVAELPVEVGRQVATGDPLAVVEPVDDET